MMQFPYFPVCVREMTSPLVNVSETCSVHDPQLLFLLIYFKQRSLINHHAAPCRRHESPRNAAAAAYRSRHVLRHQSTTSIVKSYHPGRLASDAAVAVDRFRCHHHSKGRHCACLSTCYPTIRWCEDGCASHPNADLPSEPR
jgi:hypothetical protein